MARLTRACELGDKKKANLARRRHVMAGAAAFGLSSLIGGFYLGFGFVSHDAALQSPLFEKFWLNIFIAISCGAAGMILGAYIGSVVYKFRKQGGKAS